MDTNKRNALLVVCLIFGAVVLIDYARTGDILFGIFEPDEEIEEVQYSTWKFSGIREDATTSVTGASVRLWHDANGDGVMQFSELGTVTEASGVYTSDLEYPMSTTLVSHVIHVQSVVSTYQITYAQYTITGQRNSDGSAKMVGTLYHRLTDDSLTMDGSANSVAFDTTDYNYTLSGTTGELEIDIVLSAADYGISSQIWEGIDYETVYGINRDLDFYVDWAGIAEGPGDTIFIADSQVMAATFLALYSTVQDKVDIGSLDASDFDINFNDGTNWFYIKTLSTAFGDLMYNTADSIAPRPQWDVTFGPVTAAGTFAATYGVGLWQGVTYDDMIGGTWTKGTALALGTAGDGWAWIA